MELNTRNAVRNVWLLLVGIALVVVGLTATFSRSANAGPWSGDYCTNLPGVQTIDQQGITWKFRAGTTDPDDCKAITVTSVAAQSADTSTTQPPARARWMKRPCAEEDSVNCFWNAKVQGNGHGHSYYVREFPGKAHMVCVMYVKPKDARRWDYCEANATHS